jgi:hypothetical protein
MPALLVIVALVHLVRVHALDQSSWHGSGFGMFATFDSAQTRRVLAWIEPDGKSVPVDDDADAIELARIVPTDSRARDVARALADDDLVPPGATVRVEVRGVDVQEVDGELTVETVTLASAEIEAEAEAPG